MKVAVIGANGQLGTDLVEVMMEAGVEVVPLTHNEIRIEEAGPVTDVLRAIKPHAVLNTAAFHNVPQCEQDPERAFRVNALGALHVARVCEQMGTASVYYSTDYVFDGAKGSPYTEADAPNPLNMYAGTKLLGEYHTLNTNARGCVLRVSGIYGKVPCRAKGGNFITTMKRLAREKPEVRVVDDEVLTPTPTRAIAHATLDILRHDGAGLFHLTCEGHCSWYEFARVIFDTLHFTTPLIPCKSAEFPSAVKRPLYSVLENGHLKESGLATLPFWKDALVSFLQHEHD